MWRPPSLYDTSTGWQTKIWVVDTQLVSSRPWTPDTPTIPPRPHSSNDSRVDLDL